MSETLDFDDFVTFNKTKQITKKIWKKPFNVIKYYKSYRNNLYIMFNCSEEQSFKNKITDSTSNSKKLWAHMGSPQAEKRK